MEVVKNPHPELHSCVEELEDLVMDLIGGGGAAELVINHFDWEVFRRDALEILDKHADNRCERERLRKILLEHAKAEAGKEPDLDKSADDEREATRRREEQGETDG